MKRSLLPFAFSTLLLLLLLWGGLAKSGEPTYSPVILPEPVRMAILEAVNTNPEVQERWHSFLASQEERRVARGRFFPEADIRLQAAREFQDAGSGREDRDALGATLTLNQMLYDGFFTSADVQRLGHASLVRYYELMEAAQTAALEAMRAYADVLRYRELVDLAEENYRAHLEIYGQVEELARSGVGRGVDLEQAAGRLALAESNLVTEQANLHDVTARFLRVVGRMPTDEYVDLIGLMPGDEMPETVYDANIEALASHPALIASVENVMAAHQQVRVGRAGYQPRLDLQATGSRDNFRSSIFAGNPDGDRWVNDATVGLVFQMNLFRGFADQARIGQFVNEKNAAYDTREIVCRNVRQDVTIAYNDVLTLDTQLEFLDQHQLSSDRVRTAYRQQFNIGQRTLLDLLDSENEFFVARRAFLEGQYDREIALGRTFAGLGRLLPVLGIARDAMPEISEVTEVDPYEVCPPIAPRSVERMQVQPVAAPVPAYTTQDTLSGGTTFEFDSAELTPAGRQAVAALAARLTSPDVEYSTILVEGHTCTIGPADYNQALSERRAMSVADELVRLGVRRDAIQAAGFGMDRPVADNATNEGRQMNRRVEVTTDLRVREGEMGAGEMRSDASVPALDRVEAVALQPLASTSPEAVVDARGPDWILEQDPAGFTTQIIAGLDLDALQAFAQSVGLAEQVAWYRTQRNGSDWYALVTGAHADMAAARDAVAGLPAPVQGNQPWVRSFASVHGDIAAAS